MIFNVYCDFITGKASIRYYDCEECYRYEICKNAFEASKNSLIFPQTFSINGRNIIIHNVKDLINWMVNTDKLLNEYRDKCSCLCSDILNNTENKGGEEK